MYPWSRPYVPHAARPLQAHPLSACLPCLALPRAPIRAPTIHLGAEAVAVDVAARIDTLLVVYRFAIAALRRIPSRGALQRVARGRIVAVRANARVHVHTYTCVYVQPCAKEQARAAEGGILDRDVPWCNGTWATPLRKLGARPLSTLVNRRAVSLTPS
jgi:hypothetical protein